jgi:hypothetical protein
MTRPLDIRKLDTNDPYKQLLLLAGNSLDENDELDEDKYFAFLDAFFQSEKFISFLHSTLCTYPAINDFLIKCLAHANKHQDHFDT